MDTIKITRRSKVGYGYNTSCSQHWNEDYTRSWLAIDPCDAIIHTGTIRQVLEDIRTDVTLDCILSGGAEYTHAWYIRSGGAWHEIAEGDEIKLINLIMRNPYTQSGYICDYVMVEIEAAK